MSGWAAKRFWKEAGVEETAEGFVVRLDGREVRTPGKRPLLLPTRPLAESVRAEWAAQGEKIDPGTMPITRTVNSAIDKVAAARAGVIEVVVAYGDADLLCYRAASPEELARRQSEAWDPLLDWAARSFGARLVPVAGVMHRAQGPEALGRLNDEVEKLSDIGLAAFHDLVSLSGSLIIGLAVIHAVDEVDRLWLASRVDELWQEQQWGEDEIASALARQKQSAFHTAAEIIDLAEK